MAQSAIPLFKVFMPESAHAALKPVLESGRLAAGPQVSAFESRLSAWLGHPEVAALGDASGALTLALYQAGVRPGDEVIASPLACSATLMPIANLFARPVWCDIDPLTGMMDAGKIDGLVSEKTRAILVYHWSGDVADIAAIAAAAKKHNLKLVEDASEAFGAEYKSRRLGGESDFTVYSFYATKHISCGEGAALLAKNADDVKVSRRLRRFGIDGALLRLPGGDLNPHFDIPVAGFNFPMNEIAATLGIEGLRHADRIVALHRANGSYYEAALAGISGVRLLKRRKDSVSGYWTYALLAERRDDLMRKLVSHGIGVQRLHLRNDAYSCFGGVRQNLPGVGEFDALNIGIPCGWWVGTEDRAHIVKIIRSGW
ncbi:MAG: DegT/DnrJ/EryC1/StrS family aminotransferase [Nitrosomonadales bacterium]|nr:DegT/DnrJ/EryC1/StrS family aminotransferase [Nitrosomonadales bacterium]